MNSLQIEWDKRLEMRASARKLWMESDRKNNSKASELYAKANKFWHDAVYKAYGKYGKLNLEWEENNFKTGYNCRLPNGEIYIDTGK